MVLTSDGESVFQGSGFFINSTGLAVSNYHVFENAQQDYAAVRFPGNDELFRVTEVIAYSSDEDFILFQVDVKQSSFIPIANTKPSIGERVYAIGSPLGFENTFSSGEVSQWRGENFMQISALIEHGSSGGALINEYGEVVGITSGTLAADSHANLNYAWSIDVVEPYLPARL